MGFISINPFSLNSDQYPISPNTNTAWSYLQVMRMMKWSPKVKINVFLITEQNNYLKQYHEKCIKNSVDSIYMVILRLKGFLVNNIIVLCLWLVIMTA